MKTGKIKLLLACLAAAAAAVLVTATPVKAACNHENRYETSRRSEIMGNGNERIIVNYHCDACGENMTDFINYYSKHTHEFKDDGYCRICNVFDAGKIKSANNTHVHYFNIYGVCTGCGCYAWGYYLPAYNMSAVTMSSGLGTCPVACTIAGTQDAINQITFANLSASMLGKTCTVASPTYSLICPGYDATGVAQVVRFAAPSAGLVAGDSAYAVFWNGITHQTQIVPVVVDAFGNAAFTAPNMTGTSVVTFVKIN